jgi:hypothetical protein
MEAEDEGIGKAQSNFGQRSMAFERALESFVLDYTKTRLTGSSLSSAPAGFFKSFYYG